MKTTKRFLSFILVCIMLLSFCACGKGDDTDTSTDSTTQGGEVVTGGYFETVYNSEVYETVGENITTTQSVVTQASTTLPQTTAPTEATQPTQTGNAQPQQTVPEMGSIQLIASPVIYELGDITQFVYVPTDFATSNRKYPIIAWANGTMCPPDLYAGLLQELADGGYIVIANSETMAADGTAQIGSIDFILSENTNSLGVFYNRINTEKIGVAGHSQGGRSSVNAAAADSRIDCVLSIAGSNYVEEAEKLSAPTFFMAGTNDMVVVPSKWIEPAYDVSKGPAVYASLNGAIHTTCCTEPSKYSGYGVKWFDAWLKNDASAKQIFRNGGALSSDGAWTDFVCKGF